MRSLIVSFLLVAFAQTTQAAPIDLNEYHSKKLYNILAGFGLRKSYPEDRETREVAKPAICAHIGDGDHYVCEVHDELHNNDVERRGELAKKLYDYLKWANGENCEGPKCYATSPEVGCIYNWPNKGNPPPRLYICEIARNPEYSK